MSHLKTAARKQRITARCFLYEEYFKGGDRFSQRGGPLGFKDIGRYGGKQNAYLTTASIHERSLEEHELLLVVLFRPLPPVVSLLVTQD